MSQTINELRSNNTSGVPGLRLNKRRGHLVVDVAFYIEKRYSTSFLVKTAGPITAVARAMFYRESATGAKYDITPHQAWERLKRGTQGKSMTIKRLLPVPSGKRTYWEVMGLEHDATYAEVKARYLVLASQLNPDKPGGDPAKMAELNGAMARADEEAAKG